MHASTVKTKTIKSDCFQIMYLKKKINFIISQIIKLNEYSQYSINNYLFIIKKIITDKEWKITKTNDKKCSKFI